MTGSLVPLFEGKEVRNFMSEGEPGWIPVIDLAKAWGLNRTTLFKHVSRNPGDFAPSCARLVDFLSTTGENDRVLCVNEVGMYLLLSRISISRLKNPAAQEAIRKFRQDIPKFLQQYRKNEIVPVTEGVIAEQFLDEVVAYDLREAKQIAELTGTDPKAMQAAILKKHGYPELADVLRPAIVHGEPRWYNPTELIPLVNDPLLTAERLNWYLYNHGMQYREGGIWRLTEMGKQHGREYTYRARGGHEEPRIEWRESVLYASGLKRPVSESQVRLPERA